jgi:8-oxo-dGTP pyrophosphatase MutT (NUDIX family)
MESAIRRRTSARVLLIDERDCVLLFRGIDPSDDTIAPWWLTPGGGADDGESLEQAARRELFEETGIEDAVLGPCIWTRTARFRFEGAAYEQQELFFPARITRRAIDTSGFTDLERRSVTDHRWWSVEELLETAEVVYPRDLGRLVAALLRDGPPAQPLDIP